MLKDRRAKKRNSPIMFKDDVAMPEPAKLPKPTQYRRQHTTSSSHAKKTAHMKASVIDRFGPPSVLKTRPVPIPKPSAGEVLISLHAAGVGVWDAEMRGGWWPEKQPKFPLILGADGAGIIVAVGPGVRRFRVGEQVWAYEFMNKKGGFYAEQVVVNVENVGRPPRSLDSVQAGAAAVTGLTALQGIDRHLRVRKGETVLVFGASGAVGTLAVQFAKRHGARVIGTASGKNATMLVRRLGADGIFDARAKRAVEQLRELAPNGIDAVLALAGGETLERCLDLMPPGGRIAHPNGVEPEPRPRPKIQRIFYDAEAGRREWDDLRRAANAASLRVPIAATYTLNHAAKAHARIERGGVAGRIVLRIR